METEHGEKIIDPINHLEQASFRLWSDIIEKFGSREETNQSGSQIKEAREYALMFAIMQGATHRFEAFIDSEDTRDTSIEEATQWEEAARLATKGNWSLLAGKLGSYAESLRDESIAEPGLKKEADAFTNLVNSLNP